MFAEWCCITAVRSFDCAEVYGDGQAEQVLGDAIRVCLCTVDSRLGTIVTF